MTRLVLEEGADPDIVLSQCLAVCIKLIAGGHGDSIAAECALATARRLLPDPRHSIENMETVGSA